MYNTEKCEEYAVADMPIKAYNSIGDTSINRDQEVRLRATKLWLDFILDINRICGNGGQPYIPTTEELKGHIGLFGNYILNGEMNE